MKRIIVMIAYIALFFLFWGCSSASPKMNRPLEAPMDLEKEEAYETFTELEPSVAQDEMRVMAEEGLLFTEGVDTEAMSKAKKDEADPTIHIARQLSTQEGFRVKAPQMLARFQSDEQEPLPLSLHDIQVVIASHRMRVVHDMVFYNPTAEVLQGTLMVALPQGASPAYLGMFQGFGPEKGKLKELGFSRSLPELQDLLSREIPLKDKWYDQKQEAYDWGEFRGARVTSTAQGQEVYESIAQRRVDPALTLWAGSNKFSTRIYPLNGNHYKRVVFVYDLNLEFSGAALTARLPLPESLESPTRVCLNVLSKGFEETHLYAGEKELQAEKTAHSQKWLWFPPSDFKGALFFSGVLKTRGVTSLTGSHSDVPGHLTHLLVKPPLKAQAIEKETGRALFIVDTSYSSKDKLYALSGEMLRAVLEKDTSITDFAALAFDVEVYPLTQGFLPNRNDGQKKLCEDIEKIRLEGATNFSGVLEFLDQNPMYLNADKIFLLSDGQISWGVEKISQLSKAFPLLMAKNWVCYQFQDNPSNSNLFQALTGQSGRIVNIAFGQDLAAAALAHRSQGFLFEGVFSAANGEILLPGTISEIYPGQVLELALRLPDNLTSDKLTLLIQGQKFEYTIDLGNSSQSSALAARSWAQVYADRLLFMDDTDADEMALALSQAFSLTNRVASFIILESDEEYEEHKIQSAKLDFRAISEKALARAQVQVYDLPDRQELSFEALEITEALKQMALPSVWRLSKSFQWQPDSALIMSGSVNDDPGEEAEKIYIWAKREQASGDVQKVAAALRGLSRIIELRSREPEALRMVAYVLMEWGMYRDAARLFLRLREIRPFEPQAYLLEALAYSALGEYWRAAYLFEWILAHDYPRFNDYVQPVASLWYKEILDLAAEQSQGRNIFVQRSKQMGTADFKKARAVLFWNLDYSDVDLHVKEDNFEVYYEKPESPSGGRLWWDNTIGLGPEVYQHPKLSAKGFDVFVHYFGSNNVEGQIPAATFIAAFTSQQGQIKADFYSTLLIGIQKEKVPIMPRWKW
ncbi:MAG: hypothetical protein JXR70_17175 [Spirochaetales bacterium]|nr:hypothetical protein [Spirochaetales bacterium]